MINKPFGTLVAGLLVAVAASLPQTTCAQETFEKGNVVISLGVGFGTIKDGVDQEDKNRSAFTQRLSVEKCVADGMFGGKASLGLGLAFNNSYGGTFNQKVYGKYDYHYTSIGTTYSKNNGNRWTQSSKSNSIHREGYGSADADLWRDDMSLLVTGSFHYSPMPKLDTYISIGAGPALVTRHKSNFSDEEGFKKDSKHSTINTSKKEWQYAVSYSFNDLDHADWDDVLDNTKVCFAAQALLGARYYVTEKIAVNLEGGLVNAIFSGSKTPEKSNTSIDYGNDMTFVNAGVSYKF